MSRERMVWWRWSAAQLIGSGFVQGRDDASATSCCSCGKRISGRRIWSPPLIWSQPGVWSAYCRRCATTRCQALPTAAMRPEVRLLRLAMVAVMEDGFRSKRAIVERSLRMIRLRASAFSRRELQDAWSAARAEFARRSARRIGRPYDGSSRFGWRPGE